MSDTSASSADAHPGAPEAEGDLSVPEEATIEFPAGLIGLREARRFVLIEDASTEPFKVFQCLDVPDLTYLVAEPRALLTQYEFEIPDEVGATLQIDDIADVVVLLILTVHSGKRQITANLQGPLVINSKTRRGRQLVLSVPGYTTRHPVAGRDGGPADEAGASATAEPQEEACSS